MSSLCGTSLSFYITLPYKIYLETIGPNWSTHTLIKLLQFEGYLPFIVSFDQGPFSRVLQLSCFLVFILPFMNQVPHKVIQ